MEKGLFTRALTGPATGGRAVLVGVELKGASTSWTIQDSLAELGRLARTAGLEVAGFSTQAAFLLANGIEADVAAAGSTMERAQLAAEARQLLLPGEMGESCKAMALVRDLDPPLRGFTLQDLRRSL